VHIAQRTLLVTTVTVLFLSGIFFVYGYRAEKICEQWETLQTELFVEQAARTRKLTEEEYTSYVESLNYSGVRSEVRIEEYQKEEDVAGDIYFRLVSSEEIEEEFSNFGEIYFRPESIIKITVCRTFGKRNRINIYVKTVFRREG